MGPMFRQSFDLTAAIQIQCLQSRPSAPGNRGAIIGRLNEWLVSTGKRGVVNVVFVEGFRALAYEILTWRNPRAPCTGLWVKGLWNGSAWQALASWECCQGSDYRHVEHRQIVIGVCFVGPFARCQDRVWDWRALPHRPSRSDSDRFAGPAMPGHDTISRISSADDGGARGCRQRSKVSMTTICPPQQGHGGR